MSRELGHVFDAHDVAPGRYNLECSSPGLNRPLIKPEHYQRAVGQRVAVRMRTAIDGRRRFHGTLVLHVPQRVDGGCSDDWLFVFEQFDERLDAARIAN